MFFSQEPVLFSGTIRDNILYGLRSDENIDSNGVNSLFERVVQQSYVNDFVQSLPDGYNTSVGQRGLTLSGGQRQRVAIARALIRVRYFKYSSRFFQYKLINYRFFSESKNPYSRRSYKRVGQRFRSSHSRITEKCLTRSNSFNNSASIEYN